MAYIIIGCLSFLIIFMENIPSLRHIRGLKPLFLVLGNGMLIFALTEISFQPAKLNFPAWAVLLGWVLFIASLLALAHSLYVSLPFRKTYIEATQEGQLVTGGYYSLVRHPWVILLSVFLLSLILVTGSVLMFEAAPFFILMSIISVFVQDRIIFRKMFVGYEEYSLVTPMLIPNGRSLRNFWSSLKQP